MHPIELRRILFALIIHVKRNLFMGFRKVLADRLRAESQALPNLAQRPAALIDLDDHQPQAARQSHHRLIDGDDVGLCKPQRDCRAKRISLGCVAKHRRYRRESQRATRTTDCPAPPDRQHHFHSRFHRCPFSCLALAVFSSFRIFRALRRRSRSRYSLSAFSIRSRVALSRSSESAGSPHNQANGGALTAGTAFATHHHTTHSPFRSFRLFRSPNLPTTGGVVLGFFPPPTEGKKPTPRRAMERKAKKSAKNRRAVPSRSASFRYPFHHWNAHRNVAPHASSPLLLAFPPRRALRNDYRIPSPSCPRRSPGAARIYRRQVPC